MFNNSLHFLLDSNSFLPADCKFVEDRVSCTYKTTRKILTLFMIDSVPGIVANKFRTAEYA